MFNFSAIMEPFARTAPLGPRRTGSSSAAPPTATPAGSKPGASTESQDANADIDSIAIQDDAKSVSNYTLLLKKNVICIEKANKEVAAISICVAPWCSVLEIRTGWFSADPPGGRHNIKISLLVSMPMSLSKNRRTHLCIHTYASKACDEASN